MHYMSSVREIKKPSGTYYARVESHREGKKVRQKQLKYLGTSPNKMEVPADPSVAGPLAQALMSGETPPDKVRELLKGLGIEFTGHLKRVSLDFNPPSRSSLSVSSEPEPERLEPKRKLCGDCRKPLRVKKTRKRTIVATSGPAQVVKVTRHCHEHPEHAIPPEQQLTPPKSRCGCDIIAETGRRRFLENRQVQGIHGDFRARGVGVPGRTVQWLAGRFLLFVTAVHLEAVPWLSRLLRAQGGFAPHVDGSGSSGPMVLLLKEGWTVISHNYFLSAFPGGLCPSHAQPSSL